MLIMLILVVLFAFVQQINNNLYVLYILCLDHSILRSPANNCILPRPAHTQVSSARTRTRPSRVVLRFTLLRWVLRECRSLHPTTTFFFQQWCIKKLMNFSMEVQGF